MRLLRALRLGGELAQEAAPLSNVVEYAAEQAQSHQPRKPDDALCSSFLTWNRIYLLRNTQHTIKLTYEPSLRLLAALAVEALLHSRHVDLHWLDLLQAAHLVAKLSEKH